MVTVNDVLGRLLSTAPIELKMGFDNVGLLVGRSDSIVTKILVSLDITNDVITEALEMGAELIVSHHPLFFSLKSVTSDDITGNKILRLMSGGISAICMHTNLDAAIEGTSAALARAAGICDTHGKAELLAEEGRLSDGTAYSYGRVGCLSSAQPLRRYLELLKIALKTDGLRYYDAGKDVFHVAVVSGSGGDYLDKAAAKGCDTFITADIKYDVFLEAKELGINLIDGGHFCTENLVTDVLAEGINAAIPETTAVISKCHRDAIRFF